MGSHRGEQKRLYYVWISLYLETLPMGLNHHFYSPCVSAWGRKTGHPKSTSDDKGVRHDVCHFDVQTEYRQDVTLTLC